MTDKDTTNTTSSASTQKADSIKSGSQLAKSKIVAKNRIIAVSLVVVLLAAGAGYVVWNKYYSKYARTQRNLTETNKALSEGNKEQALAAAREALAISPNDWTAVEAVAGLTDDPEEKKLLYGHAIELYKEAVNFDDKANQTPISFWAVATLAEKAGDLTTAKQYYQKVIDTADPDNEEHQSMIKQANEKLKRLK